MSSESTSLVSTFSELSLCEPIQQALKAEQYTQPTPIQAQSIPHLLAGQDLLGCAQTGTGKTAAFALPILHKIETSRRAAAAKAPFVLVLTPTRELASQIGVSFQTYGKFIRFRHTVIYGGVGQTPQVRAIDRGVHVLIATPGRLLDLVDQGHLTLDQLDTFVLDEADRMLDMGFMPDLKRIIALLPKNRQSLFFSATMPGKIATLARTLLKDPVRVSVTPESTTVERIEQSVMRVEKANKRALLQHLLETLPAQRVIVFSRTKHGADKVARFLGQKGIKAEAIHGDKTQSTRERALLRFRRGMIKVLVATDLAARGIDIDGITHVINFDLPHEAESYVHRIGRTARAGADGIAISFCDTDETSLLRNIERTIKQSIRLDRDHPFHTDLETAPIKAKPPRPSSGKASPGKPRSGGGASTKSFKLGNRPPRSAPSAEGRDSDRRFEGLAKGGNKPNKKSKPGGKIHVRIRPPKSK